MTFVWVEKNRFSIVRESIEKFDICEKKGTH